MHLAGEVLEQQPRLGFRFPEDAVRLILQEVESIAWLVPLVAVHSPVAFAKAENAVPVPMLWPVKRHQEVPLLPVCQVACLDGDSNV
jgi:hypothetical protein